jgi:hypothetical protein
VAEKQSQSKPIAGLWLEILNQTGGEKFPGLSCIDNFCITVFFIDFSQEKRILSKVDVI